MDAVPLRETETVNLSRTNRTSLKGASTFGVGKPISVPWKLEDTALLREDSTVPLRGVVTFSQREHTVVPLKEIDAVPLGGTYTVILSRANRTNLKGASTVHVGNLSPVFGGVKTSPT